jgi:DNA topoisomerase-1
MLSFKTYFLGGGGQKQWSVLRHNGPLFPPEYIPHKTPVIINNKHIILNPLAEEYASLFAKYIGTKYIESNLFKKNFWKDFKPVLNIPNVNSIDQVDFSLIKKYLDNEQLQKKNLTKEQKLDIKEKQLKNEEPYMFCIIDGVQQKVGNYKIEPPGIFLGRGSHPKLGRIKKRVRPEDVILNLDKTAPIPKPNVNGKWQEIIHDNNVIWLASWKDNINDKVKYVFTSLDSFFKAKSDEDKFNLARKLKKKILTIKTTYEQQLKDNNPKYKQLATALYFIDNLALRVGGKKDSKEEADTVGVTSLRVEHLQLLDNNTIKLDFLGKDSIRYCRKVSVHTDVYNNLKEFIYNKSKKDDIFDLINSSTLNEYLDSFLHGLTAKVWRTYNASILFQKEIDKLTTPRKIEEYKNDDQKEERLNFLISVFNHANSEVALLCNHQKTTNTNIDKTVNKINNQIKELKKKKKKYKEKKQHDKFKKIEKKIKIIKMKLESKIKMKNVSLTTSKNNYIDPRIIFAFIKKYNIEPKLLLNEKLLIRFKWASSVDSDFKF